MHSRIRRGRSLFYVGLAIFILYYLVGTLLDDSPNQHFGQPELIDVWLCIPVYNAENFLDILFESILKQSYTRYKLLIIDDGSNSSTVEILQRLTSNPQLTEKTFVVRNEVNYGAAHSKWQFVQKLREFGASPNDVVVLIDGDDHFTHPQSVQIIVQQYIEGACWMTYGSFFGDYSDQTRLSHDITEMTSTFHDYQSVSFPFGHPRTWLFHLFNQLEEKDFQDGNGTFLRRYTDREMLRKTTQLAGLSRLKYIDSIIYHYTSHPGNARNLIPNNPEFLQLISARPDFKPMEELIHIILCVTLDGINRLQKILETVDNQTIAHRIILHIINNDGEEGWDALVPKINSFTANFTIVTVNASTNLHGFGRLLYARKLISEIFSQYVIFINDDQTLPHNYIQKVYDARRPYSYGMSSWFVKSFNPDNPDYWDDDIISMSDIMKKYPSTIKNFDYLGTGGSIIDTRVLALPELFQVRMEYREIEDLWLSFIVKKVLKGSTYRLYTIPELIGEEKGLLKVAKNNMLKKLVQNNYLSSLEPTFDGLLAPKGEVFYPEQIFLRTMTKPRETSAR